MPVHVEKRKRARARAGEEDNRSGVGHRRRASATALTRRRCVPGCSWRAAVGAWRGHPFREEQRRRRMTIAHRIAGRIAVVALITDAANGACALGSPRHKLQLAPATRRARLAGLKIQATGCRSELRRVWGRRAWLANGGCLPGRPVALGLAARRKATHPVEIFLTSIAPSPSLQVNPGRRARGGRRAQRAVRGRVVGRAGGGQASSHHTGHRRECTRRWLLLVHQRPRRQRMPRRLALPVRRLLQPGALADRACTHGVLCSLPAPEHPQVRDPL